jgi:hypothetical protein
MIADHSSGFLRSFPCKMFASEHCFFPHRHIGPFWSLKSKTTLFECIPLPMTADLCPPLMAMKAQREGYQVEMSGLVHNVHGAKPRMPTWLLDSKRDAPHHCSQKYLKRRTSLHTPGFPDFNGSAAWLRASTLSRLVGCQCRG